MTPSSLTSRPLPPSDLEHVLGHASEAFEALRGARLLITGGTGFFGRWLLESLAHADRRMNLLVSATVVTRNAGAFRRVAPHVTSWEGLDLVESDVRILQLPGESFSHMIHAATEASAALNDGNPLEMYAVCAAGTERALEVARDSGVARFLLASSGAVYGRQPPDLERVPESWTGAPDPLEVNSAYAQGKRAAEWYGAAFGQGGQLEVVTARAFAFVGPLLPMDAHFAAGNFLRDALAGGPIRVGGDGTPYRSYLYAADLAAWLWVLLIQGQAGRAYNVGSDRSVSIADLAKTVAELRPGCEVSVAKLPVPGAPAARYVPSIDRARQELGLDVWVPLPDALRRTYEWAR